MREVVDGVLYDTDGAQFVVGYKTRRGRGGGKGGQGGSRLETGAMYVMPGPGENRRIFLVERPTTGEAMFGPVDAGTARVVVDEWCACGLVAEDAARMALTTLDMVAPVPETAGEPPAVLGGNDGGNNGRSGGGRSAQ